MQSIQWPYAMVFCCAVVLCSFTCQMQVALMYVAGYPVSCGSRLPKHHWPARIPKYLQPATATETERLRPGRTFGHHVAISTLGALRCCRRSGCGSCSCCWSLGNGEAGPLCGRIHRNYARGGRQKPCSSSSDFRLLSTAKTQEWSSVGHFFLLRVMQSHVFAGDYVSGSWGEKAGLTRSIAEQWYSMI